MIRYKRKDKNHKAIAEALTKIGASVFDASDIGTGFPDLIVGYREKTFLMEIKNDSNWYGKKDSHYKTQKDFKEKWRGGEIFIVRSIDEATKILCTPT